MSRSRTCARQHVSEPFMAKDPRTRSQKKNMFGPALACPNIIVNASQGDDETFKSSPELVVQKQTGDVRLSARRGRNARTTGLAVLPQICNGAPFAIITIVVEVATPGPTNDLLERCPFRTPRRVSRRPRRHINVS